MQHWDWVIYTCIKHCSFVTGRAHRSGPELVLRKHMSKGPNVLSSHFVPVLSGFHVLTDNSHNTTTARQLVPTGRRGHWVYPRTHGYEVAELGFRPW